METIFNKLYNFYLNNKKNCIIFFIFICIIITLLIINLLTKNNNSNDNKEITYELVLFGKSEIEITKGDEYIEPGYYAYNSLGEIKTDLVEVINLVDTNKVGNYTITYKIGEKTKIRNVLVLEKEVNNTLDFSLNGNSSIVINKGDEYEELGAILIDSVLGDISNTVIITGEVNTNIVGTYIITYSVLNNDKIKELTRTITVVETSLDAKFSLSTEEYTNGELEINIEVIGSNFSYIRYSDSTFSENKISSYKVNKNGTYRFYIYDKEGNYITKEVIISNIDKELPSGTCKAIVEKNNTTINVYANDNLSGIKNYSFYGDSKLLVNQTSSVYNKDSEYSNVYVIVYDKAGNKKQINCSVEMKYDLEVHYINVGREDAILIRSSAKTILIDGGTYSSRKTVTPYLQSLGITHIDAMIGSHLHYNHIQAQADILENFTVGAIYYPQDLNTCYSTYCDSADQKYILDAIKKYNKEITIMKVNDNINIGNMNIFCIGPIKFQTKSQNKYRQNYNSLNFILTYGNTKFMFTGDYMQSSNILSKFSTNILDIDVLKYPHHGQTSIGKKIIEAMTPKYTVITNTKDGLSGRSEKNYLKNVGSELLYSYKNGNILIISDGTNLTVKSNVNPSDYKR